jgi:hypothetical protein
MGLAADLERFVTAHRACGQLVGDATEPILSGYRVWIACPCGARFDQWVTDVDAEDLMWSA